LGSRRSRIKALAVDSEQQPIDRRTRIQHDMRAALTVLSLVFGSACAVRADDGSYLDQPAYCLDKLRRGPTEAYALQEGDIVFSTDYKLGWEILFALAGTGRPTHSGIVFRKPDGQMAILEAGPHDTLFVEVLEALPHLRSCEDVGSVWIRKRRTPLTCEQSERLTSFAMNQNKRRFAVIRLGGQLTPLRSRGPIRTRWVGGPHGERDSYFCCELLMEACVAAGLVDPATTRPAATYPRDVFFDRSVNPYINRHLNLSGDWFPPARWSRVPFDRCGP
jgi:hypothetical protein